MEIIIKLLLGIFLIGLGWSIWSEADKDLLANKDGTNEFVGLWGFLVTVGGLWILFNAFG